MTGLTMVETFRAIADYEDTGHVPGCAFADLSYYIDCHCAFTNMVARVRAEGFTEYPAETGRTATRLPLLREGP